VKEFPFFPQQESMDCGPTCLLMIASFYGKDCSIQALRAATNITEEGVSLLSISEAAESIGFRTSAVKASFEELEQQAVLPLIAHWRQTHFVVVYRICTDHVHIADPGSGLARCPKNEFLQKWAGAAGTTAGDPADEAAGRDAPYGFVLLLEPSPSFYTH